ncbi:ribosomal-processing cysteine protease Prp [Clostridium sp. MD294]|uniref:ribosomal-processing cysteine protease Prp n=1 Tax=Clostridium sp. MD294 TaxID=97138 RepID=UPI0002CB2DD0|nr:ribosomal-processing cysteine protease Prp [Clostridium sp. MD294]NDO46528.1 ribosomal-processing cysteine protease Prp [Clostridium sp. MD294]USF29042.1 hypothetical protein C820_000425 [Clostridium sp. MD294]
MIKATIYHNSRKQLCGYCISGHAGFAQKGEDIVCAAVSILAINTVNAIEQLTTTHFHCNANEQKGGYLKIILSDAEKGINHDTELLLKAMVMGLEDLSKEYKKYIRLNYEEV